MLRRRRSRSTCAAAGNGDSLLVDGSAALAGTLAVKTAYAPATDGGAARPRRPGEALRGVREDARAAPRRSRLASRAYDVTGVTLGLASGGGGVAPTLLARPSLRPAVPVVGGRTRCLPGKWKGAHALTYEWLRGGKPIARAKTDRAIASLPPIAAARWPAA